MATKTSSKKTTSRKSTSARKPKGKKVQSDLAVAPVLKRVRSTGWLAILESLIIGILGVMLIVDPSGIVKIIFYIVGIFLIVKGVYHIVNYFAVRGKYDFYNNDLLYGIIAFVFGVICMILWEQLGNAIGIVVGAWMIYGALVRLNTAIKLHTVEVKEWFYVLLLSLVMLALGIYMIVSVGVNMNNMDWMAVVGWMMVGAAVIGIVNDAIFLRNINALEQ